MFGLGLPELLIIALIILLIFGAKRIPGIGSGLGKTVKEIRSIKKELNADKESPKKVEQTEGVEPKEQSLEGKLADSLQDKLKNKVLEKVPGIGRVKQIKDKADKIKKIVS